MGHEERARREETSKGADHTRERTTRERTTRDRENRGERGTKERAARTRECDVAGCAPFLNNYKNSFWILQKNFLNFYNHKISKVVYSTLD